MRTLWKNILGTLITLLVVTLGVAAPSFAHTEEGATPQPASGGSTPTTRVVVIGAPGLMWSDIGPETPALKALSSEGVGSLVVRSRRSATCPIDGWLALNTGTRVIDPEPWPCRQPEEPQGGLVPHWDEYVAEATEQSYPVGWGLLTETVGPIATFGPGAAIAGANAQGEVADHTPIDSPAQLQAAVESATAPVLIVDAGSLYRAWEDTESFTTQEIRAEQLSQIDQLAGATLAGVEASDEPTTVILAGLADDGTGAKLRALAISSWNDPEGATGSGPWSGELTASSTKQPGFILGTDLLATVAAIAGHEVPGTPNLGSPATVVPGGGSTSAADLRDVARDNATHATSMQKASPVVYLVLVVLNLLLFAGLTIALSEGGAARVAVWFRKRNADTAQIRRVAIRGLETAGVFIASIPISTFLANLLPWWRDGSPVANMLFISFIISLLITLLALGGPWRRSAIGPVTVVALITAVVIFGDLATVDSIQTAAPMGRGPIVGGRFYGMNNTAFILGGVAALFVAAGLAHRCIGAGQRVLAAVMTLLIGAVVTVIDGAPSMGADFGGPPAMIPAFVIMALMVAGVCITWKRILVVGGGTALVMVLIVFMDWLRPPDSRTHLGRFFQDVLDGELFRVIGGKLRQNFGMLFGNIPLTLLALAGVAAIIWLLIRPVRRAVGQPAVYAWLTQGTPLTQIRHDLPTLLPLLIGLAILGALGMALNDSGIIIPAVGVALAAPLLFALCASWLRVKRN